MQEKLDASNRTIKAFQDRLKGGLSFIYKTEYLVDLHKAMSVHIYIEMNIPFCSNLRGIALQNQKGGYTKAQNILYVNAEYLDTLIYICI